VQYGWIVGGMTLVTVGVGVGLTYYLAVENSISGGARIRLMMWALYTSLVVPIGVIGLFALWWAFFLVVFGYHAYSDLYHRAIVGDKRKTKNKRQQGLIDHLTFVTLITAASICVLSIALVVPVAWLIEPILGVRSSPLSSSMGVTVGIIAGLLILASLIWRRFRGAVRQLEEYTPDNELNFTRFTSDIIAATLKWIIYAVCATGLTLMAQGYAYSWFTSLLR
jgi:ABC-type Na+ efflux pump permease subunit